MSERHTPITPQQMSVSWLESVLGVGVADVELEPIGEGTGFAGSVYRLNLQYAQSGTTLPDALIWKIASNDARTRRFLATLGAYETETRFYGQLANSVEMAPSCYFSHFDPDGGEFCLLTEDVSYLEAGDQIEGCSLDQAMIVARETARFHARFWGRRSDHELDWAPTFDEGSELFQRMHTVSWERLSRRVESVPDGLIEAARRIAARVIDVKERLSRPPLTLLHGDLRLDNIFFGREPKSAGFKLIDWQAVRMGRGAYDIAYFLSTSVPVEMRRRYQEDIIREYVQALSETGVSEYSYSDCMEDFGWALLDVVTFMGIIGSTLDFQSKRGLELSETIMERLWSAVEDNSALDLLE